MLKCHRMICSSLCRGFARQSSVCMQTARLFGKHPARHHQSHRRTIPNLCQKSHRQQTRYRRNQQPIRATHAIRYYRNNGHKITKRRQSCTEEHNTKCSKPCKQAGGNSVAQRGQPRFFPLLSGALIHRPSVGVVRPAGGIFAYRRKLGAASGS